MGARYRASQKRKAFILNLFKKLFLGGVIVAGIGAIVLGVVVFRISKTLPDVSTISTYIPAETTKIYSVDGEILAELHREENRILIPIERISPILSKTVIALEDTDFYKHNGINPKAIMRALYKDIKARAFVEGGSTLTQQLAKNLFLTKRKKISRKLAEAVLAIQIEQQYTKTEILEMYLNQVYWGHNSYGIESAAKLYFGKTALELTLAESAMLVGMLKGPELYSPYKNMAGSKKRQKMVLNRMRKLEFITPEEADAAYEQPIQLAGRKKLRYKAPYFTAYIIKQLEEMYGTEETYTAGMKVYTSLNYRWQKAAEQTVEKYLDIATKPNWVGGEKVPSLNYRQAAILALEPSTGYIRTMVGGSEFLTTMFNRTTQAKRQPGSSFKPFVYLAALDKGFSPGSIVDDSPVTFNTIEGPYSPSNYNKQFSGKIPMRKALEKSINVVSIKLNDLVGPHHIVKTARKLGIQSPMKPVLSLPLGANEVSMMELTSAYGVIANRGRRVEPSAILRIEDRDGSPLYQHKIEEDVVFERNKIDALVEMMTGIVKFGTGKNAKLPRPSAGKTGTTSDYKDAWYVGFIPQLVAAAWIGNDDNEPMYRMTGGGIPASMWREFMKAATKDIPAQRFPRPRGMVSREINWDTGLLANEFSPEDRVSTEKYWKGKEPKKQDTPGAIQDQKRRSTDTKPLLDFFE